MNRSDYSLPPLPAPLEGEGVYEPHMALDSADPTRAAIVAVYPSADIGLGRSVWCWQTTDAGANWSGSRVVQALWDDIGVADPLVAYGADGSLVTVAMALDEAWVRVRQARRGTPRLTAPTLDESMQAWEQEMEQGEYPVTDLICLSSSDDHGQTWNSTVVPNSGGADKTALAVDAQPASPFNGHIYTAWCDGINGQVAFARSTDGGQTAEPAIRVGGRNGTTIAQLAVGAHGIVHLLWLHHWTKPEPDDPRAPTGVFYASSLDGGATFSEPAVIAEHIGGDSTGIPALVAAPDGALLAAWSEADAPARERGAQVRNTVRWIHSPDGTRWTDPAALAPLPADISQGLPAIAATASGWHMLVYEAGPSDTWVRSYTANYRDSRFRLNRNLAHRRFGANDIFLHGTFQLRHAYDLAQIGDYVGFAGARTSLGVAIVLPETDAWQSTPTLYAAILPEA